MQRRETGSAALGNGDQLTSMPVDQVIQSPHLESLSKIMQVEDWRFWLSESPWRFAADDDQDASVREIAKILYRSRQRHALLVGQAGVGKTTIMRKFAQSVCNRQFDFLNGSAIIYLNVANVGPEDSRACTETVFGALTTPQRTVLCVDELVHLLDRPHGGSNKPLIRALLDRPNLSLVATMHHWDYMDNVLADRLMRDCFTKIAVSEPDSKASISMASVAAERLAEAFELDIADDVVEKAVNLTTTFVLSEYQPSKAIRILEQVCEDQDFDRKVLGLAHNTVAVNDVVKVVSNRTNIPAETISGQGTSIDFVQAIQDAVVGQENAVRQTAQELQLIAAGLVEPNKPASVMMFAGTTGVGKTQLAKRIAELYSTSGRLQVYSMGNYTESHSVSGLMGVPPGYVGHEEGGKLVSDLLADPYSVFLFDEAEKCHPNVWKPFLNLFDEGWVVDQRGRKAYADRAIFILTTNAGDRSISQLCQSGIPEAEVIDHVRKTLSRVRQERSSQPVFPPQFLARVKRIIVFKPLTDEAMTQIVHRNLRLLSNRWLQSRQKVLDVCIEAIKLIADEAISLNKASEGQEGGRIANKLLSERLEHQILCHSLQCPEKYETSHTIKVTATIAGLDNPSYPLRVELQ